MKDAALLLAQLRDSEEFKVVMKEALKQRPIIPGYQPLETIDKTTNAFEQMKHQSARQQGFDYLYQWLTGTQP